jgi:DNA phosphorothioation-associated putative methyltransferase
MVDLVSPIPRHKTAIRRSGLSLPVACLLRDGLVDATRSVTDYGCGLGQDAKLLHDLGVPCDGWDPVHRPDGRAVEADVVNLGYVINVIEDPVEREQTLRKAWELCRDVLAVSAIGKDDAGDTCRQAFSDGALSSRGTFQKRYTHSELKSYLEEVLPVDAVAAAPNVYYLFRSEEVRQRFLASRYRRAIAVPRLRMADRLYEQHKEMLDALMASLTTLGRLPGPEELPEYPRISEQLGSLKRAFQVIRRVTGSEPWTEIATQRRADLLVYLAMALFGRRQPLGALPVPVQRDIKAFLGSYASARDQARQLLFAVGSVEQVDAACTASAIGALVENGLLVRRVDVPRLDPLLRAFEGCARAVLGEVETANVVKLHRYSGKVSYLACAVRRGDPYPLVRLRVKVDLPRLSVHTMDFATDADPPRLDATVGEIRRPGPDGPSQRSPV